MIAFMVKDHSSVDCIPVLAMAQGGEGSCEVDDEIPF